eukprot:177944_1
MLASVAWISQYLRSSIHDGPSYCLCSLCTKSNMNPRPLHAANKPYPVCLSILISFQMSCTLLNLFPNEYCSINLMSTIISPSSTTNMCDISCLPCDMEMDGSGWISFLKMASI